MFPRVSRLGVLLLIAGAALCHAQKPSTPVEIENTNSTFTPTTVNVPEASPARPTVTAPAHIPPTGYLQFEQGMNQADTSPGGLSAQSAINQTTKIALTTRLLVQFISQPYTYNVVDTPSGQSATSAPGDLDVGAQYILHKEVGAAPTVALGYIYRVRAGTANNLDVGDHTQSALLLMSGDLPHGFHYDSNLIVLEQQSAENSLIAPPHPVRRAQFEQSAALSHLLFAKSTGGRLTGVAELSHFTQPFVTETSFGTPITRANTLGLLFAATFALRPNLVFDAAFDHGLTSTSTQWQGDFGLTYLLPHRLWRDRHPKPAPVGVYHYRNLR
jgi:hypothetical protein